MSHELVILSPEKTLLTYRLAGPGSRILAHLLDGAVILTILYLVGIGSTVLGRIDVSLAAAPVMVAAAIVPFFYFILMEGLWNGQTLGKKAMGIRVRMSDGTPITFFAAVGRNFIRPADFFPPPYFAGLLAMFITPRSQRLGDLVANTVVVIERRTIPDFVNAPHRVGVHPIESYVGELRGMTLDEYHALRRLCDRFPELSTAVQERMLAEVWRPIAIRRGVPEIPSVHPIYIAEAMVMRFGRSHGLL